MPARGDPSTRERCRSLAFGRENVSSTLALPGQLPSAKMKNTRIKLLADSLIIAVHTNIFVAR